MLAGRVNFLIKPNHDQLRHYTVADYILWGVWNSLGIIFASSFIAIIIFDTLF